MGTCATSDGWEGHNARLSSTCPIAQALHYQGDYEWETLFM